MLVEIPMSRAKTDILTDDKCVSLVGVVAIPTTALLIVCVLYNASPRPRRVSRNKYDMPASCK